MKKLGQAGIVVMILARLLCADVLLSVQANELETELSEAPKVMEESDIENRNMDLPTQDLGEMMLEAEAAQAEVASGGCGQNAIWSFDESSGILTISGSGAMENYFRPTFDSNIPWYNFRDRINEVVIENGITTIGTYAFANCNLTSIIIPDSVTTIEACAFRGSSLRSITIPDSVTTIGTDLFYWCDNLTEVFLSKGITTIEDGMFLLCSSLKTVNIPNGVTDIKRTAFMGCSSLTSVTIPSSVTNIGNLAFGDCGSLKEVTIPESVTNIGYGAFSSCSSLESVTIPNAVAKIGNLAFSGCSSLTAVDIPAGISLIGAGTFDGCKNLQKVSFRGNVTEIQSCAFQSCDSLTTIDIPNTVTKIEYNAFYNCSSLSNVTIPSSVSKIEGGAFAECSSLSSVWFMGDAPEFSSERADENDPPFPYDGSYTTPMEPFANVTANVYYLNGNVTWTVDNMLNYGGKLTWLTEGDTADLQIDPIVTDRIYVIGSGRGATIKCTGELKDFVSIAIDDVILDPSNYTAVSGSTVITIMSSYLDKLSVGRHKVTLNYTYGSVDTTLLVLDRMVGGTNPGISNGGNQSNSGSQGTANNTGNENGIRKAPKTGDYANACWPVAMLVLCSGELLLAKRRA